MERHIVAAHNNITINFESRGYRYYSSVNARTSLECKRAHFDIRVRASEWEQYRVPWGCMVCHGAWYR